MKQQGFTLIELVMIMIVVGILAVYAVSSVTSLNMDSYSGAEELVQAIRYAQQEAMDNTNAVAPIGITISPTGFTFIGITSPIHTWRLSVPDGVNYAVNISPTGTITFNGRGVPTCAPIASLSCTATSQTFTVDAGGHSDTFTVEPFTGLAHR